MYHSHSSRFSKAFDTLNHDILAKKLSNLALHANLVSLLQNYLSDRGERTIDNGILIPLSYHCGVLPGSVLGPVLFLTNINDMHSSLNNLNYQYHADDTVIYIHHSPETPIYLQYCQW